MNDKEKAQTALASHIALLHSQRHQLLANLGELSEEVLWRKPAKDAWSIGENFDHLRVIYNSWLGIIRAAWFFFQPIAHLKRGKPFETEIDNVYRRPGFPQKVGWMWPPRYTPEKPVPYETLKKNLEEVHHKTEKFYLERDPLLLAHVPLSDPAIGTMNLIQALRVAIYHDEMHIEQILLTREQVMSQ